VADPLVRAIRKARGGARVAPDFTPEQLEQIEYIKRQVRRYRSAVFSQARYSRSALPPFTLPTNTDATPSVAQYHNRMPVVLDNGQFDDWMRGTPEQAAAMMKPYAGEIEAWEVGAEVGNARNNRPELMERVGLA